MRKLGSMSFSSSERKSLGELLLKLGPDAPTLDEGWVTRDLVAHLLTREHNPIREFTKGSKPVTDYPSAVRRWMSGPPLPLRPIDHLVNTAENFIHHEDVRRGGGEIEPREFSEAANKQLTAWVRRFGTLTLRKSTVPVILQPTGGTPIVLGKKRGVSQQGDDVVRVSGDPGELLLWVTGRDAVEVNVTGDETRVSRSGV